MENVLKPAKIDDQPANERLRVRSIMIHLWQECSQEERGNRDTVNLGGETGLKGKRTKLLETFRIRYGFLPSLDNQPSEACLGLLSKMHLNKPTEFSPLSRVSNYADGRGLKIEPQKIKGTPFLMEASALGLTKKNSDFCNPPNLFAMRSGF